MIWANLLHLSFNMWEDRPSSDVSTRFYQPFLRFDETLWNDLLRMMVQAGMNMVVLDLGDGVRYESRPEITVENAWPVERLQEEMGKVREMGLEMIPKLNFSTAHDTWLGDYSRMVSTKAYYEVCRDLIEEVISIFGKPRFFHLGYDEETPQHQRTYDYMVVRQHELWWHDFEFFVREVERHGVRPWIWSDYYWNHPEEFIERMPRAVLQSNWYYGTELQTDHPYVKPYTDFDEAGFDQIPTGSNHSNPDNFGMTVDYCAQNISAEHLLGFLQTPWKPTLEVYRKHHLEAIEQVQRAIAK
jgi:hypothetical protein